MEKKETTAEFLARMEATYGPQPALEDIYERRLRERQERKVEEQAREQRRRERLRRLSFGLLGGD
jgi:hypothetical protein